MKTKIITYPSIVLATYETKLRNQAIFSLLVIETLKKNSSSIFKISFWKKLGSKKRVDAEDASVTLHMPQVSA
jgi:hypothetical protein